MVAANFGSGSGGWAIPLAKKLEQGKVIAIDILEEPLSALKSKLSFEGVSNIEIIRSNIETEGGSKLPDSSCDLVLMTNLLFEIKDRKQVLSEGKRVLKEGGKILIVDWELDSIFGPKRGRLSLEDVKKLAKILKFKTEKEFRASPYHWGLILSKPRRTSKRLKKIKVSWL